MLGLQKDRVSLQVIDATTYKIAFEEEKSRLVTLLEGFCVSIEHVGSTAILGIMAKPIIDIAIGIKNLNDIVSIKPILEKNGYVYLIDNGEVGRFVFIKTKQEIRTHHLHVEEYGKECWNNHIDFRDCLLNSSDLRNKYETLKIQLAQKYAFDRKCYTAEKAAFIQGVLSAYRKNECNEL